MQLHFLTLGDEVAEGVAAAAVVDPDADVRT